MRRPALLSCAATLLLLGSAATPTSAQSSVPDADEFSKLHFRSIGPASMSGRVADLAVYEANPAIYYVGTAHGGVWKTTSNGATFEPLFQDEGLIAIGDVTVSQLNPDLVWVGAGESNNRQSTSWGGGVYKSTDGGKTFALMGLPQSRHINRIIIHPTNNDVVLVAATGPLFGPGGDRGVYKTVDGGKTWKQVLTLNEDTGANDLAVSLSDPNILYASSYQRRRTACCMNGGGPGSALWRSTDGGDTWTRLSGHGLPSGPLGRIAVDVYRASARIVYALIEGPAPDNGGNAGEAASDSADRPAARADSGRRGGARPAPAATPTGIYRSDDGGETWKKVSSVNPRPMYFSQLRIDPTNPERLYLGGVGMHMTVDGGRKFETDAAQAIHDDVHAIWIDPANPNHLLIGNDGGLAVSYDMSRTWTFIPNLPVGLFYHVGYDMEIPYNVCGGMQDNYNWCGPSASRMGKGIMNYDWFQVLGGDGFVAIPDVRNSRIIYTESQDGNIIRRDKLTGESKSIRPTVFNVVNATKGESYRFHWDTPLMQSPNDPGVLLTAANRVFRSRDRGDSWEAISPDLTRNVNRDSIVTMGVKGSEITIARNDGISQWPSIVALAESPRQPGVFYAGTDDGTVSVSRNGGQTWQDITRRLPGFPAGDAFVSKIVPSRFDPATVYLTVDNHRQNDYETYMWVSTDFGANWRSMAGNLRGENVRTLTEDLKNRDVLYIGTETGIFLSLDRGGSWRRLRGNLPTVRVDELTIHPRDNALLVATHGRALWILDHLEPIQEHASLTGNTSHLVTPGFTLQWKSKDDRNDEFWGHQFFTGENPPLEAVIPMYIGAPLTKPALRISDAGGRVIRTLEIPASRNAIGLQTMCWDQRVEPIEPLPTRRPGGAGGAGTRAGADTTPAVPGVPQPQPAVGYKAESPCPPASDSTTNAGGGGGGRFGGGGNLGPLVVPGPYTVSLVADGKVLDSRSLRLVMDPMVPLTGGDRARYNAIASDLHELHRRGTEAARPLVTLYDEVQRTAGVVDSSSAPAAVKARWKEFRQQFDSVRVKFGVPAPAGGRFGGGGGGPAAAAAAAANVLGRVGALKGAVLGVWEMPTAGTMRQVENARREMQAAIVDAQGIMAKARAMSQALSANGVTMKLPD